MKKNILLVIAILTSVTSLVAQVQDTIFYNRNWDVTTKDFAGYYRIETKEKVEDSTYWSFKDYYLSNDQVQNEGFFVKKNYREIRCGKWFWYYENGNLETQGNYKNNQRVGLWSFYHKNGALKKKGTFTEKGLQDGEWFWYHPDSTFMSKATYKEDTIIGGKDWFYSNGQKRIEEYFVKGKLDSVRKEWYSTGAAKSVTHYKDGFKEGNEKNWYLNGQLKSDINYSSGIVENELWYNMKGDSIAKDSVVNEKEFHNLLWKITGNGLKKPSYLFGTMHVKDKDAFEFSDSMLLAFNEVEGYSMEIHPDSLYSHSFKQFDKRKSWYYFGTEVIGERNPYSYYDDWSASYNGYDHWIMNLNQIFHRDVYEPEGMPYFVDCYLFYIATKQGKFTDGIEKVSDHVNAGKNLPRNSKRYDILTKFNPEKEMMLTYKEGNLKKINALMEFLQNEEFRYRLLTVRNIKMADAIDSLVQIRSTFNTAGTAHLPGEDGVIKLLEDKGYTLTAVNAVFSGDSLDPSVNKLRTNWRIVKPFGTDFTVNSPGPLTTFGNGVTRNIYLDPIREIGVDAYQLDERWFTSGSKTKKIEESDIDYLLNNPIVSVIDKVTHQGRKGKEIFWKEVKIDGYEESTSDVTYSRTRLFKKDFQIYVITVSSLHEDSLKGEYATTFLNSVVWNDPINEPVEWVQFQDTLGAFKVSVPENVKYDFVYYKSGSEISNTKDHKVHYWVSQEDGNKYIFRYSNSPNGRYLFNDSLVLAKEIDYYYDMLTEPKDTSYFDFQGYPGVEARFKANKKHELRVKFFNRGYRHYQLIAQIKDDKESKKAAEKFFNSFEFTPLSSLPLKSFTTEEDSVTVDFPELKDGSVLRSYRWFVPERAGYSKPRNYERNYTGRTSYSYRSSESVKAYNNRNQYYGLDTAQGVTYQLFVETFSEYFKVQNRDSLFNYYQNIFSPKTDSIFSITRDSTEDAYSVHIVFQKQNQNGEGQLRFTQKGQVMVGQRVVYPEELKGDQNINQFFNSLDLSAIADTVDLFEDKAEMILDSLMATDTVRQRKSRMALRFYPFDSTHVASIQSHVLQEIALDTNDIENNTMDLLHLLTYVNDSTTAAFVYDVFTNHHVDSLLFRTELLSILHALDDSLSYIATIDLMKDSIQAYDKNSFVYKSVLGYFKDSIQIYADNFEVTDAWMKDTMWLLETEILSLANQAYRIDSIRTEGIERLKDSLIDHYYWVASVYDSMDKDSSLYRTAKRNITVYTELVGYLGTGEDSCSQIFIKLLDDKDEFVRLAAAKALFRGGSTLTNAKKERLFKSLKNRYKFMQIMNGIDNLEGIPEKYSSKESVAEAQFYYALTTTKGSWHGYQNNSPVKIKLLKKVKDKIGDEKVEFYVFSYYEDGYSREKRIGVSNPFPIVGEVPSFFTHPTYEVLSYGDKKEKKMIKRVVENWKKYNGLAEGEEFSEEAIEEVFKF